MAEASENESMGRGHFGPLPVGLDRLRALPGVLLALGDQALASGANFLFVVAVARAIDLREFGLFSLAFAVVLFCGSLIHALVALPVSVLLPERTAASMLAYVAGLERVNRVVASILLLLAVPVAMITGEWQLAVATAVAVAARSAVECHRRVAYGLHDGVRALLVDVVGNIPLAASAVALLVAPQVMHHAWEAMAVLAGCSMTGWLAGTWLHRRAGLAGERLSLAAMAREHWNFGRWNLGGALALWGSSQLYPILGLREVALLNGSMRLMGISNVVMQGIEAYSMPRLRRAHLADDPAGYLRCWRRMLLIGGLCLAPVTGVALLMPEQLLTTVLGAGFAGGGSILAIAAVLQLATFAARMLSVALNALKEPRPGFWGQTACAVLTVSVGPVVVAWWGIHGAALAVLGNALLVGCVLACSLWWVAAHGGLRAPAALRQVPA
jgi:O-antigen/teichoic acid export membrane protein